MKKFKIINASAGTGKTHTLKHTFCDKVQKEAVQNVIATTFTEKAAAELKSEIRQLLLKKGETDKAGQVLAGNIGTINSVFGRMVSDNAFALGISPKIGIIEEKQQTDLFNKATASIREKYEHNRPQFAKALEHFKMETGWFDYVVALCAKYRQNGKSDVDADKQASFDFFDKLLPFVGNTQEIQKNMQEALIELKGSRLNKEVVDLIERCKDIANWSWEDWITANSQSGVKYETLSIAAGRYLSMPELRDELKTIIFSIFDCAKECMDAYQNAKKELGVIDFIDQETDCLTLLTKHADVACERLKALYVDEFQDTSPIQLALFSKILCSSRQPEGVYVGDPKQSIYKFRGTDPLLINEINKSATERDTLETSYRTVKPIVEYVNGIFENKFASAGLKRDQILITKFDRPEKIFDDSVVVWETSSKNTAEHYEAVAQKIKELINSGVQVYDKKEKKKRTIRGSDIAVFMRTNAHVDHFAQIAGNYFKVSSASGSLFACKTVILLMSVLALLPDEKGTLAKAHILKLTTGFNSAKFDADNAVFDELKPLRDMHPYLTPCEIVDSVLGLSLVQSYFETTDNTSNAYAEADAFRGLVQAYEEECQNMVKPATLANMLATFKQRQSEENFAPVPASPDKDAVAVLSYHKSKGLEWPITVCMDCNLFETDYKKQLFTTHEFTEGDFNIEDPLASRCILCLPWGLPVKGDFEELLIKNASVQKLITQAEQEYDRLMYVGLTRARDCLILHKPYKITKNGNTEHFYCRDNELGTKTVPLDLKENDNVSTLTKNAEQIVSTPADNDYDEPFIVNPSVCTPAENVTYRVLPLPALKESVGQTKINSTFGTVMHAVMAQKEPSQEKIKRIVSVLNENLLPVASEIKKRFDTEIVKVIGTADILSEWPISVEKDGQLIRGSSDMIALQNDGFYIIDHKFLDHDTPQATVETYAKELWRLAQAVEKLCGKKVKGCILHCPLQNSLLLFDMQSTVL